MQTKRGSHDDMSLLCVVRRRGRVRKPRRGSPRSLAGPPASSNSFAPAQSHPHYWDACRLVRLSELQRKSDRVADAGDAIHSHPLDAVDNEIIAALCAKAHKAHKRYRPGVMTRSSVAASGPRRAAYFKAKTWSICVLTSRNCSRPPPETSAAPQPE